MGRCFGSKPTILRGEPLDAEGEPRYKLEQRRLVAMSYMNVRPSGKRRRRRTQDEVSFKEMLVPAVDVGAAWRAVDTGPPVEIARGHASSLPSFPSARLRRSVNAAHSGLHPTAESDSTFSHRVTNGPFNR